MKCNDEESDKITHKKLSIAIVITMLMTMLVALLYHFNVPVVNEHCIVFLVSIGIAYLIEGILVVNFCEKN